MERRRPECSGDLAPWQGRRRHLPRSNQARSVGQFERCDRHYRWPRWFEAAHRHLPQRQAHLDSARQQRRRFVWLSGFALSSLATIQRILTFSIAVILRRTQDAKGSQPAASRRQSARFFALYRRRNGRFRLESSKLSSSSTSWLLTKYRSVPPTYFMRALSNLRISAIAIVTILAMLIVPACGSLCASMNHCSSSAASAEPDACHHANMSSQSYPEPLSSPASCGQQSPLLATLAASDSSLQLESAFGANALFSIDVADHASTPDSRLPKFSYLEQSPQQSAPRESLSVLRI